MGLIRVRKTQGFIVLRLLPDDTASFLEGQGPSGQRSQKRLVHLGSFSA